MKYQDGKALGAVATPLRFRFRPDAKISSPEWLRCGGGGVADTLEAAQNAQSAIADLTSKHLKAAEKSTLAGFSAAAFRVARGSVVKPPPLGRSHSGDEIVAAGRISTGSRPRLEPCRPGRTTGLDGPWPLSFASLVGPQKSIDPQEWRGPSR